MTEFKDRFFDENGLPEFCYLMDRVNNVSILVKRGQEGFYPMDYDLTAEGCKFKNEQPDSKNRDSNRSSV